VTVHHHPSPVRHAPGRRQAAVWRSRLLTALMRLPVGDVVGTVVEAVQSGRPGIEGLVRAVPDVPAGLHLRRRIPGHVRAQLRLLTG
jgi:hypothetical protein